MLARKVFAWQLVAVSAMAFVCSSQTTFATPSGPAPVISTRDVELFYRVYDSAGGHPSADQLQHDYIDVGSAGLHQFAKLRKLTGASLAEALVKHPLDYSGARGCLDVLPRVSQRLKFALRKLVALFPAAHYPPVTILIGRDATAGTVDASGVLVGLETVYRANWADPNSVEDRLVHVIAHEYVHIQQRLGFTFERNPNTSLLLASEIEGGAEFIDELITGSIANTQLLTWTKGREKEIDTDFVRHEDQTDLTQWLESHGKGAGTPQDPAYLGYWVGYRIVKSYYQNAADKRTAVRDILQVRDAKAFLARSGWYPGIQLK